MKRCVQRTVVASLLMLVSSCGASRVPATLRGYDIVVQGQDSQSIELARAMREYGFHVRPNVRGGSRPTAALIHFVFSEPGPDQPTWLHIRLADTRSGLIVGVGAVQLDSTTRTPRARATAVVQALSAP
ncbi:MAG TPA: hypothetical protein VEK83_11800 [Gemmatimonadales bacterium]|nr:hypothetical protein [Gemmatimonadales bacterium]